jgi:hypothetical protein
MPLIARCPTCKLEFKSPIQMDRVSFESGNVTADIGSCPQGHPVELTLETAYWLD